MAVWYLNRPENKADSTELSVAQTLKGQLDDDWTIRWGFYYGNKGQTKDKEGDFIIQGPCGRVLVMEVKGGSLRRFAGTGTWENRNSRNKDHPITQLLREWKAIVEQLNHAGRQTRSVPYIGKALCCPNVDDDTKEALNKDHGADTLIFGEDLSDFKAWWERHVTPKASHARDIDSAKSLFKTVLLAGMHPRTVNLFLTQSDQIFADFQDAEFAVLEMLQANKHWMVEGGVGTAKNFMALKQAEIVAQEGEGRRVLLLTFNLVLTERMKALVAELTLARGSIEVRSWEELVYEIIESHQAPPSPPSADAPIVEMVEGYLDPKTIYYGETLPTLVDEAFAAGAVVPSYDALVVPEAQNHHTNTPQSSETIGWWGWYFKLLKGGSDAPIYLFYDPSLRTDFYDGALFEPKDIREGMAHAVQVELKQSVRYTRQIFDFLAHLCRMLPDGSLGALRAHSALPHGPNISLSETSADQVSAEVRKILMNWRSQYYGSPDQVVLVGKRSTLEKSSLRGISELLGYPLVDYEEGLRGKIAYISAHRARGLDFRSIILIDFPPYEQLFGDGGDDSGDRELQKTFFLGASRTRQLLGVIRVLNTEQDPG